MTICGLFIDAECRAHICLLKEGGKRAELVEEGFRPFLWAKNAPIADGMEIVALEGEGDLCKLLYFDSMSIFARAASDRSLGSEIIRPVEAQYLMHKKLRFYTGMTQSELRRLTLDIERSETNDASACRITAIGLMDPGGRLEIMRSVTSSEDGERTLLEDFGRRMLEIDPDLIEGHGIHDNVLSVLATRARALGLDAKWGRFGQSAQSRKSRIRIAERWLDYMRADIPGRSVFDTAIASQIYDISQRDMSGYALDEVAEYFEIDSTECKDATFSIECRLKLARAVSGILLPTYFAQAQNIPIPMQEACLRGSSSKVDSLLFERYYHARRSLPPYPPEAPFEGAFSKSFETGVFHDVMHYDVASLYPSLLLSLDRAPQGDSLGAFIPLLDELRTLRLEYKKMAKEAASAELASQYGARQRSFKILINSFYGYLGFPQARFADPALAAEITRRGRELIQNLIVEFQKNGCKVLEADTDGIYLSSPAFSADPEALLAKVAHVLPKGVSLEFDGRYESMFCYKAKNYALLENGKIHVSGSAFRSRSAEPFLKNLTNHLVKTMLGAEKRPVSELIEECRALIASGKADVALLARSEYLSMAPEAYRKKIDEGGKPRRAALEVALRMMPQPRMGERVLYYITPREKGATNDWQRARPIGQYDHEKAPYAPEYYLGKLDEWEKRFESFVNPSNARQNELPF
jgi:DNA polymerase, archaea type